MRAYHHQIIDNVVSYIALRYFNEKNRYITQTLMYKILALLDFRCLKQRGTPCVEFSYTARKRGPVPEELYSGDVSIYESFKTKKYKKGSYDTTYYISIKTPDLDYIAPTEKNILDDLLNQVFLENINGEIASVITHKEIRAWKVAYEKKENSLMNYADEFANLDQKEESEMTIPELNFIRYKEFLNV